LQAKEAVDQKLKSVEGKVNEKLGLFSANGANSGQLALPGTGNLAVGEKISQSIPATPTVGIPNLEGNMPSWTHHWLRISLMILHKWSWLAT
jgi:hypothetical protein